MISAYTSPSCAGGKLLMSMKPKIRDEEDRVDCSRRNQLTLKFSGKVPGSAHQMPSVSNSSRVPILLTSSAALCAPHRLLEIHVLRFSFHYLPQRPSPFGVTAIQYMCVW